MNKEALEVIADRGYRGRCVIGQTKVEIPRKKTRFKTSYEKRKTRIKFRRRASIEPMIEHLKTDTGLGRNYLKGIKGDKINVMLAAAAYNIRKWMRNIFYSLLKLLMGLIICFTFGTYRQLKLNF